MRSPPIPPPRAPIEQVFSVATRAPNFWETGPWRLHLYGGVARGHLGEVFAQARVRMERQVPCQAPVVVAALCIPADHRPNVEPVEELEATAAVVQNLTLAAPALGLGSK